MALWSRRRLVVPAEVLAGLGMSARERVLASASLARGSGHVALTITHIHVAFSGQAAIAVDWDAVLHASWQDPLLVVIFDCGTGQQRLSLDLAVPGDVPTVVRERVTSTVIFECHRTLPRDVGVRFIARRGAGRADVQWAIVFDDGARSVDDELQAQARAVLQGVRADIGL